LISGTSSLGSLARVIEPLGFSRRCLANAQKTRAVR
jgi:hypothetical protein